MHFLWGWVGLGWVYPSWIRQKPKDPSQPTVVQRRQSDATEVGKNGMVPVVNSSLEIEVLVKNSVHVCIYKPIPI